jgi:hypothetical protein
MQLSGQVPRYRQRHRPDGGENAHCREPERAARGPEPKPEIRLAARAGVIDVFLNVLLDHIEIAPGYRRRSSRELIYIVDKRNSGIFIL